MVRIHSGTRRPSGRRAAPHLLAVLLVIACSSSDGSADTRPRTHSIAIQGFEYRPAKLTVAPGDTVVWINKDVVPHTATAEGEFDSGSIGANQSWRYVAGEKGTYAYDCTFHPNMKGTLVVR
jgi:plastocyanin